jgi:hypothetical protein
MTQQQLSDHLESIELELTNLIIAITKLRQSIS